MIVILINLFALIGFVFGKVYGNEGILNISLSYLWIISTLFPFVFWLPYTDEQLKNIPSKIKPNKFKKFISWTIFSFTLLALAYFGHFVLLILYLFMLFSAVVFRERVEKALKE